MGKELDELTQPLLSSDGRDASDCESQQQHTGNWRLTVQEIKNLLKNLKTELNTHGLLDYSNVFQNGEQSKAKVLSAIPARFQTTVK